MTQAPYDDTAPEFNFQFPPEWVIVGQLQCMDKTMHDVDSDALDRMIHRMHNSLMYAAEIGWQAAKKSLEMEVSRRVFIDDCIENALDTGAFAKWLIILEYTPSRLTKGGYTPAHAVVAVDDGEIYSPADIEDAKKYTIDHASMERVFARIRHDNDIRRLDKEAQDDIREADLLNDSMKLMGVGFLKLIEIAIFGEIQYS